MFITNGPCCTTGSPMGRPCSSRSSHSARPSASSRTGRSATTWMAACGTVCAADAQRRARRRSRASRFARRRAAGSVDARAGVELERPDRDVGVRARGPRVGRRRRAACSPRACRRSTVTSARLPPASARGRRGISSVPEHREVRLGELVARGQVQPDLEQLERVRRRRVEQREHLRVHDAAPAVSHCTSPPPKRAAAPSESE